MNPTYSDKHTIISHLFWRTNTCFRCNSVKKWNILPPKIYHVCALKRVRVIFIDFFFYWNESYIYIHLLISRHPVSRFLSLSQISGQSAASLQSSWPRSRYSTVGRRTLRQVTRTTTTSWTASSTSWASLQVIWSKFFTGCQSLNKFSLISYSTFNNGNCQKSLIAN